MSGTVDWARVSAPSLGDIERLGEAAPNMVWLYRRPILDDWNAHDDTLGAIVPHVMIHEIGHHFGLSDDDIAAIEPQTPEGSAQNPTTLLVPTSCGGVPVRRALT